MVADYHIHSTMSSDGVSTMAEQVAACAAQGIQKLCFTEHVDINMPGGQFVVDLDAYARELEATRRAFPQMTILMGLELGDTSDTRQELVSFSDRLPLDFKLLSRHRVEGVDPGDGEIYFAGKTRVQAAEHYLQGVLRSVTQFPDYDALAHLGYVFKFVTGERFPPLRHADCPDLIDAILLALAQRGKALEVNTSRWMRDGGGIPGADIVARFVELGGEWVTLGSDAHRTDRVAQGFGPAVEQLKGLGLGYLASFEGRRLVPIRL